MRSEMMKKYLTRFWMTQGAVTLIAAGIVYMGVTDQPSTRPLTEVPHNNSSHNHPLVDPGPDQTIVMAPPGSTFLHGEISDDGLPFRFLSARWTSSGPGNVVFADNTALDTVATFSEPGEYKLVLKAYDGHLSASESVTVTVHSPS